jgi:ribosome recycling factor
MIKELLQDTEERMVGAVEALERDLKAYRTGRANPEILDRVKVEVYGTEMELKQMAVISVPEPQQLAIRPYDVSSLSAIERAILKSDLGLNPNNDGKIIRLNIPSLTEERRRNLTKQMNKRVEEARVAVRNVRRDALNDLRDFENDGDISEDEFHDGEEKLQKATDHYIAKVNEQGKTKEQEIMEV